MTARRCPRHPSQWFDSCGFCEALMVRQEIEESDPPDDGIEIDEARYERWLEEL